MSRMLSRLAELQPALFCKILPERGDKLRVRYGERVHIVTARGRIEAHALVTPRMRLDAQGPFDVEEPVVNQRTCQSGGDHTFAVNEQRLRSEGHILPRREPIGPQPEHRKRQRTPVQMRLQLFLRAGDGDSDDSKPGAARA